MKIKAFSLLLTMCVLTQPATANSITVNYTYDDIGRLDDISYSSGVEVYYGYDAAGNLTFIHHAGGDDGDNGDDQVDPTSQYNVWVGEGGEVEGPLAHGSGAVFEVTPDSGFRVDRKVQGSCAVGSWVNSTTYEAAETSRECSVYFYFTELKRRSLPPWLFIEQE